MDYLFRLADGRRLALWSEKNQIVRQLSGGGGNRSHITMRSDFLSDLSAVSVNGRIYFVYQNTARMVMLYLPDAEEDLLLFGESIESCRHSDLTLAVWEDGLYLFYVGWSPIRERYFLKARKLALGRLMISDGQKEVTETVLGQEFTEPPEYRLIQAKDGLTVLAGEDCWKMRSDKAGGTVWNLGKWAEKDRIERWRLAEETVEEMQSKLKEEQEKTGSLQKALGEERAKAGELQKASLAEKQRITAQLNQLRAEKEQLTEKWECLQSEYQKQAEGKSRLEEEIQRLAEECEKQKLEQEQYRTQLQAAVNQYNELAEVARQLQIEGKKWRDKYFQETKKRKERSLAAKGKQSGE